MSTRGRGPLIGGALALVAAAAFCAARISVVTDITHFLPTGPGRTLAGLSRALAEGDAARTLTLGIMSPDLDRAAAAAADLAARLRARPDVAWVRRGVGEAEQRAVWELYFPRRLGFLSDRPEMELGARLSDEGLARAAADLKRALAQPTGELFARAFGADPLGAFPALLGRMERARAGGLGQRDGQLVTRDGTAILLVGSRASAFRTAASARLLAAVDREFSAIAAARGGGLTLQKSGVHAYAVASERGVRTDLTRISTVSTAAVALLFLIWFRSLRLLLLSLVPLVAGLLGGTAAVLLLWGRVHGVTLAFGSALIGVCVDYPIHFFNYHALHPHPDGPEATLRGLWPGLLLGAATTMAGLAGIAWTGFPGVREMALFSVAGVSSSLAATRWLLPALTPASGGATGAHRAAAGALVRLLDRLGRRPARLWIVPALALGLCAATLPRVRFVDDLAALNRPDPRVADEDLRLRRRLSNLDPGRLVIARGRDDEQALARNDRVHERLRTARADGLLDDFRSLHDLLWSADLQRRNLASVRAAPRLAERAARALAAAGFRPEAFAAFGEALARPPAPLLPADLARSPLADAVRPFRVALDDGVAVLTPLGGVRDLPALRARLADLDGVVLVDQRSLLAETWAALQRRTLELLGVGLPLMIALLWLRYRRWRPALAAFLPAALAAATTLAAMVAAGVRPNLLHVLGLLLVLNMGVDYGVFVVENRRGRAEGLGATLLSVVTACLTTVLSFGLMAWSEHPALRALGLTTGLGSLMSLLLAPTTLALLGEARRERA